LVAVAQHIADWLNNLGMFEYAPRFVEIYVDILCDCRLSDLYALTFRAANPHKTQGLP
jgi:hypothetical protein